MTFTEFVIKTLTFTVGPILCGCVLVFVGLVFDVELINDLRAAGRGFSNLFNFRFFPRVVDRPAKSDLAIGGYDFDVLRIA